MIVFDTPRPTGSGRFRRTAHMASTLPGEEGTQELLEFGRKIGLKPQWLQHKGEDKEHFDLFDGKIAHAKGRGAKELPPRDFWARTVLAKRAWAWGHPEHPEGDDMCEICDAFDVVVGGAPGELQVAAGILYVALQQAA